MTPAQQPSDPRDEALVHLGAQYERLLQRLETNERDFRRLGRSVWKVQEDERRRLARELHDGLGQTLTALKHRLARLLDELPDAASGTGLELAAAISICSEALEDTRHLSRLLRPPILDDLGLHAALQWLARTIEQGGHMAVVLELEPLPTLDGELETLLFRVSQEALNNASKHAQASSVLLRLVARGDMLELQVIDDGRGCDGDVAMRGGSGLGGMRERLRLYGGTLQVRSTAGHGLRLRACVPLDAA